MLQSHPLFHNDVVHFEARPSRGHGLPRSIAILAVAAVMLASGVAIGRTDAPHAVRQSPQPFDHFPR